MMCQDQKVRGSCLALRPPGQCRRCVACRSTRLQAVGLGAGPRLQAVQEGDAVRAAASTAAAAAAATAAAAAAADCAVLGADQRRHVALCDALAAGELSAQREVVRCKQQPRVHLFHEGFENLSV